MIGNLGYERNRVYMARIAGVVVETTLVTYIN